MEIKAVLFDLDGILIDSVNLHYQSLNKALLEIANYKISLLDHNHKFNGLTTRKILHQLVKLDKIKDHQIEEIFELKQDYTRQLIFKCFKIDEGKIELLSYLKENNYKIACITNSNIKNAKLMLEITGQLDFMDLVIGNDMVKNPKPDPEGYNKSIEYFGFKPEECLVVEDSPVGIEAGRACGAHLWIVKNSTETTLIGLLEQLKGIK